MQRALMEKTLTGQWSCPTAPAPERTMSGWFFIDAWGIELCFILSSVGKGAGYGPFPRGKEGHHRKQLFVKDLLGARNCAGHFLYRLFHLVPTAI